MKIPLTLLLVAALFVSAVQVVGARHQARRSFVEIQELQALRDDLHEEWGRLQLEQSTWSTTDRVEQMARTTLHMSEPDAASVRLLWK
jgi:cell division protein FtsL